MNNKIILADTRQQKDAHITNYFDTENILWIRTKLDSADYMLVDCTTTPPHKRFKVLVDTKKDILEVLTNLCKTTEHERVKREISKAKDLGCERFIFLGSDNLLPSHASMVHGLLDIKSIELNSASGVCCSGMSALKYGFLSIKSGNTNNAVCTGSERASNWMQSQKYNEEINNLKKLNDNPIIGFNKDFLRWMLSDGAGAFLIESEPRGNCSLRIDWMEMYSYAYELEACMYAGGEKQEDGSLKPWMDYTPNEWLNESIFSIKQDVKLLNENIVVKGISSLKDAVTKNNLNINEVDYYLPHMSSYYFEDKLHEEMVKQGIEIPKSKWFTNLDKVGNIGSASIYLIIDELKKSGKLTKGQKIVVTVPESGRFSYFHILLTVC